MAKASGTGGKADTEPRVAYGTLESLMHAGLDPLGNPPLDTWYILVRWRGSHQDSPMASVDEFLEISLSEVQPQQPSGTRDELYPSPSRYAESLEILDVAYEMLIGASDQPNFHGCQVGKPTHVRMLLQLGD